MNKKSTLQFWNATRKRRTMNMGIGLLGGRKLKCPSCDEEFNDSTIVFKRKFRWTIEGETPKGKLEPLFVKVAARPNPEIEETEINFLSAKTWIPGKVATNWEKVTCTAFDVNGDFCTAIFPLLPTDDKEPAPEQLGKFTLNLYDGCGCLIESWDMSGAYISKIAFGELDYSSSEETTIEFDISYKKENLVYKNALNSGEGYKQLPPHLSYGYCGHKVTCPNCKHEFRNTDNIIF